MLSEEQIKLNKETFINLVRQITREGADIEGLINKLENSDFFTAPCSTMYHSNFAGGLCQHSLNVYNELVKLVNMEFPHIERRKISNDSILITALFHDISKMNFYETSYRNVKDETGNWTKVPYIKVKEAADRFIYSTHGVNSEYMIGRFIPLTLEESVAIIQHMGGKEAGAQLFDSTVTEAFNRFPLAALLHVADMLATYLLESI